ncbi:MAG: serine protease, partial [Candidatus Dormibacteraeota bacterium]|nr:serine protease [Candidatus Dormibacteraeota bacterium]
MPSVRSRIRTAAIIAVAPLVAGGALVAPAASAATRASVQGGTASWVAHASSLGHAGAARQMSVRLYLAPRGGEAALEAAVTAVSTPGSGSYGRYLSAAQYHLHYDPTDAQAAAVAAWLASSGLRVTGVEAHHRYVSASGSVATVEQAFATSIGTYRHNGQEALAPSRAASIPASLASLVLGVTGLDTTQVTMQPRFTPPPPAFVNARPCSLFYGQLLAKYQADYRTPLPTFKGSYRDYAICGYAPDQFRSAYEGPTTLTGAGVTVAITDA